MSKLESAPAPMEGHGSYNRNSQVQAAGLSPAIGLFEAAARAVVLAPGSEPIVIADYGVSEGQNSLAPIGAAIEALRRRIGVVREISVIHTDLPDNDFSALFEALETDPASYLRNDPAAFASAVGRSFYGQILPSESVTLGWSSWSVQWLSRIPGPIPDQVQVAFSRDAQARAGYASQSAEDWRAFLSARGRELRSGGRLVVLTMAIDENGDFGYAAVVAALNDALNDLIAEGLIDKTEAARMAIPTVGRSRADLLAPFVDGVFAGLRVDTLNIFHAEDRIWEAFQKDGDATAFGKRWAGFNRASVFPTLALGLAGGRDDPRKEAFADRMEAAVAARLSAKPEPTIMPLAEMTLIKI